MFSKCFLNTNRTIWLKCYKQNINHKLIKNDQKIGDNCYSNIRNFSKNSKMGRDINTGQFDKDFYRKMDQMQK